MKHFPFTLKLPEDIALYLFPPTVPSIASFMLIIHIHLLHVTFSNVFIFSLFYFPTLTLSLISDQGDGKSQDTGIARQYGHLRDDLELIVLNSQRMVGQERYHRGGM